MQLSDLHAFVINVPKELFRYMNFKENTKTVPIEIEHISAVPLTESIPKSYSKTLKRYKEVSHEMTICKIIKTAKDNGYKNVLIFEDDAECRCSAERFEEIINQIPDDFDVCYLGAYIRSVLNSGSFFEKVTNDLVRFKGNSFNIWGMHAIIINEKHYDEIYNFLIDNKQNTLADRFMSNMVNRKFKNSLLVNPPIFFQSAKLNSKDLKSLHNTNFNFNELETTHLKNVNKNIRLRKKS